MNNLTLIGRLTKDPELRQSNTGTPVVKFTIAVPKRFKKENQPDADFIPCTAFGKTAEIISQYFTKGRQIGVQGRLQSGSYQDKTGQNRFTLDVIVENFDFISDGSGRNSGGGGGGYQQNNGYQRQQNNGYQPQSYGAPQPQPRQQQDNGFEPLPIDDDFSLLEDDDDVPF